MDIRKLQLNSFCLLLLPLSVAGQEWSKQDSLRIKQLLESEQEIKINKKLIENVKQNIYYQKPFVDFDPTMPTLKASAIFPKPTIHTYKIFPKLGSTFLSTYSHIRLNKNLILHSKSNFAESPSHFHIQTRMEYKLSSKWSLTLFGSHNLDNRSYRGLPSEAEPIKFGGNIVFQINKNWKMKTEMQYQYNALRKKWEWIPQIGVSYTW